MATRAFKVGPEPLETDVVELPRVNVFLTGTHNGYDFKTVEKIDRIVESFNATKDAFRRPVKRGIEHLDPAGDPAWGIMADVWREGEEIYSRWTNVPRSFVAEMQAGRWLAPSIELDTVEWKGKTYEDAPMGVVMLGADLPGVSGLKPVFSQSKQARRVCAFSARQWTPPAATEAAASEAPEHGQGRSPGQAGSPPQAGSGEGRAPTHTFTKETIMGDTIPAANPSLDALLQRITKLEEANAAKDQKITAAEQAAATAVAENKEFKAKVETFEREKRDGALKTFRQARTDMDAELVKLGVPVPAVKEQVDRICSLGEPGKTFSAENPKPDVHEELLKLFKQLKKSKFVPTTETAPGGKRRDFSAGDEEEGEPSAEDKAKKFKAYADRLSRDSGGKGFKTVKAAEETLQMSVDAWYDAMAATIPSLDDLEGDEEEDE